MNSGDDFRKMVVEAYEKQNGAHVGAVLSCEFTNATQDHHFAMWTGPNSGGPGVHKLLCSETSQERLNAHWQGFVENLEAQVAQVASPEYSSPVVEGFDYAKQRSMIAGKLEALGFCMAYEHGSMPGEGHTLMALASVEPVEISSETSRVVIALAKEWSDLTDRISVEEPIGSYQELIAEGRFDVVEPVNASKCIGRVLWSDGNDAVQSLGRNKVVVHDMRAWPQKLHTGEQIQTVVRGSGPVAEPLAASPGVQR